MSFCKKVLLVGIVFFAATTPFVPICAQENAHKNIPVIRAEESTDPLISFFTYAADEQEYKRKKTGIQVVGFLAIYALIMWRVKKKIWKDTHRND